MDATIEHQFEGDRLVLRPAGGWVIGAASELDRSLGELMSGKADAYPSALVIDLSAVRQLDTAGAFLLARAERAFADAGGHVEWAGVNSASIALLERVREALANEERPQPPRRPSLLEDVGETVLLVWRDSERLLSMLGGAVAEFGLSFLHPRTFRASAIGRQIEVAGVRAVPIIALMSFLIGGIIAQQGAFQLQFFGASLFTVDLVGILSLREVAPLLTAIMVAGRSGSAITAELGSMQMREEVDALRVMGLDPVNVLVLPRVLALVLVLPLLSFLAALATLAGALLTLWFYIGIPPVAFLGRLRDAIDFSTLFSGLLKAPFMALIIALIACSEGMAVRGSAESLGTHTTASVVKSIFMVIVVDGIFAIFYAGINF
jgi:phospholipid/cholesterol/gamma-HCH transport system permease protein